MEIITKKFYFNCSVSFFIHICSYFNNQLEENASKKNKKAHKILKAVTVETNEAGKRENEKFHQKARYIILFSLTGLSLFVHSFDKCFICIHRKNKKRHIFQKKQSINV